MKAYHYHYDRNHHTYDYYYYNYHFCYHHNYYDDYYYHEYYRLLQLLLFYYYCYCYKTNPNASAITSSTRAAPDLGFLGSHASRLTVHRPERKVQASFYYCYYDYYCHHSYYHYCPRTVDCRPEKSTKIEFGSSWVFLGLSSTWIQSCLNQG